MSKWSDNVFKILSFLVIPLLGWGIRLEVTHAVQVEKTRQLEKELSSIQDIRKDMIAANLTLAKLGEKIDAANFRLVEIKSELLRGLTSE